MTRSGRLPVHLLFTLLLLLLGSRDAAAVELTGTLRGTVEDPDGLAVPEVVLTLSSPQLQGVKHETSDAEGQFRFLALPVGDYVLKAELPGFQTQTVSVRVRAGAALAADLTLVPSVGTAEVVVQAEAPVVDTRSTRTGITMSREMLRDIPSQGRDYQGAMSNAPGTVDNGTGNPNMRGGLSFSNQYFVDGVNTTDPITNTFSMNMNYDAIEELQVITGGMDAEYGRAMGGAVNIVTRSGGNTFEGDAQLLYSSTATQVYKPLPEEEGIARPDQAARYLAANVGGPIQKDKLWFFTGVQLNSDLFTPAITDDVLEYYPTSNDPGTGEPWQVPTRNWRSAYLFGKLTWKPSTDHRVWLHAQGDPTAIDNAEASVFTLANAETWWQQGGWLASLGHQWTPGDRTIVDTQLATSNNYINLRPIQWKDCGAYDDAGFCNQSFDAPLGSWFGIDADGFSYGTYPYAYSTKRQRHSLTTAVTRFVEGVLGDHEFKAGVQADLLHTWSIYPGLEDGIAYYRHDGDPANLEGYAPDTLVRYDNNGEATLGGWLVGAYLQDVWNPWPRLTLRPGVRMEASSFTNNVGEEVYSALTFAPRIGAAYDLTGDGRTRVHAYYGRFYDVGFLEVASVLAKDTNGGGYYSWDEDAGDWSADPYYAFADSLLVHDDLKVPHSDEVDLGVIRDLGDGWAVGATFVYKESRNLFEDDEVNLIWNDDGTAILGSRDGTGEARYRLRTPDEAFVQYTSMEFTANRQFSEKWGMISSYTWSRAYGRERDDVEQGLASSAFDVSPLRQYEVGLMPYDTPHNFKIAGAWRDPSAWSLGDDAALGALAGWNQSFSSGYPYRPGYYNDTFGDWSKVTESIDGDYRMPAFAQTDLKAGLTLSAGKTAWDLTVECFNVFNSRTVTAIDTAVDEPDGSARVDADGNLQFGQALARQQPRTFQIGLRGEF